MRRSPAWLLAMVLSGLGTSACGGTDKPQMALLTTGAWNDNPSTVAETGYQVGADVAWLDRPMSCFDLPADLTININDVPVTPMIYGDCRFDALVYSGAFQQDVPISVTVQEGGEVLAQAEFQGLFPGAHTQLVSPASGQVKAGDPIVVTMPISPADTGVTWAEFYWLDMPANAPPFNTSMTGTLSADGSTFQTTAPSTLGRAALVLKTVFNAPILAASTCTGFESCAAEPDNQTIGPAYVEVVP
jgi:hypothetical protein